ncbi:beta strand repeat-containing protein, partial [Candidatus Nitrosotalea bavarica]|uniref:beta strand repeat-containing protein n=1 Tax=Candidatus Nitrosotalea bavarica TaxID=1903277 RepID=UPI0010549A80
MEINNNSLLQSNKKSIKNILIIFLFTIVMFSSLFSNGSLVSQAMASGNTTSTGNNATTNNTPTIDNTSLTVTSNPNTISAGGQVILTATVTDTSSSPTTPTGTVTWNAGNAGGTFSSSSCTLSSSTCNVTYTTSATSPSNVVITASYSGDTTHQTSSGTSSLSNAQDTTTIILASSASSISSGGQVTVTATVTDSTNSQNAPTGTITWGDGNVGGNFNPTSCTLSSGTCSVTYIASTTSPSNVIITATYAGDTTHKTSYSTYSVAIAPLDTPSVVISPNSSPFVSGTAIAFTVTVTDTSSSPTTPSGQVSWNDGNAGGSFSSSTCVLSANTCTTSYTPAVSASNSITITASYGGDATHQTSSGTSSLLRTQDTASVAVTSSTTTVSSGAQVTVTATVTDPTNSQNAPTGTITWSDGSVGGTFSSSSCTLASGTCNVTYTASSSVQNTITITASYSGDTGHTANSGTSILAPSSLSPATVTMTSSTSSVSSGGQVTFTVTVVGSTNSQNTPTGTITWGDGNIGGNFNPTSCTLATGTCNVTYTPSTTSPNNVVITASYSGDTMYQTSSGTSNLTVNTTDSTTLSVTPNPSTAPLGGSVIFTATVADTSSSPTTPTSSVSWSDGNAAGSFSSSSCTLSSSGSCTVTYIPAVNPPNAITITASYAGDGTHQSSTGSSTLSASVVDPTTSTITPNPATFSVGTQISFIVSIADTTNPSSTIAGLVTWTDNGAGGSFSPSSCVVVNNQCGLAYTPPSNPTNSITITATYAGDSTHSGSTGTSTVSVNTVSPSSPSPTPSTPTPSTPTPSTPTPSTPTP